ncbi:YtfJ family protein [Hydrogenimonas sp.]
MRLLLALWLAVATAWAVEVGRPLPRLILEGADGGCITGQPFDSDTLRGKVTVVFYVDPDKKSLNEPFTEALKARHFDRSRYRSVAIVNMAATWMPNFAIASALKKKQSRYPDTLYVKDLRKKGVKVWSVADDDANFLVLSKEGVVLYARSGRIPPDEYDTIFSLIQSAMNR